MNETKKRLRDEQKSLKDLEDKYARTKTCLSKIKSNLNRSVDDISVVLRKNHPIVEKPSTTSTATSATSGSATAAITTAAAKLSSAVDSNAKPAGTAVTVTGSTSNQINKSNKVVGALKPAELPRNGEIKNEATKTTTTSIQQVKNEKVSEISSAVVAEKSTTKLETVAEKDMSTENVERAEEKHVDETSKGLENDNENSQEDAVIISA